ncbi:hypothetical protein SNE40_013916 [Patella caerulea]|uniref:Eukaryotic translation initiation factor 4E n=1 Tax=Patella caerulea TaxID=87958 RepID=A0AAN8PRF5_PATCE
MAASNVDSVKAFSGEKNDSPKLAKKALHELYSIEESGVPLNTPWTFWLDKTIRGTTAAEYEASLRKLYTVNTVEGFWSVYNNIPNPGIISTRYSYHLMRHQIRPIWEDEDNSAGGNWRLKCHKFDTVDVWKELLLAAIGEQFSNCMGDGDEVTGISVSLRDRDDILQIWNSRADLAEQSTIINKVKSLLPNVTFTAVFYKAFVQHDAFEGKKPHQHR